MKNNLSSAQATVFPILYAVSASHMLNDTIQSVIPAVYPMFKENYALTFSQIGMITMVFQLTASILQPVVGHFTDKHPFPKSLAVGMLLSLAGIVSVSFAQNYSMILISVALVGMGSSVFHPEASRVAQMAGGNRKGLAQSIFQVGGNFGSAIGPLLAALIVVPFGQNYITVFGVFALIAIVILSRVGSWYKINLERKVEKVEKEKNHKEISKNRVIVTVGILLILMFSKYFYLSSISNYFTFFLIDKFGVSVQQSQLYLFAFMGAVAAGTLLGGPIGDKYGRKFVIWFSILGVAPFTMLLPYVSLFWTIILAILTGFILASAFPSILVYATELIPGKVGTIAGLFFGMAFGLGGIASAVLGNLADRTSISFVFAICAYLPLLGLIAGFLPRLKQKA